jgi:hypothetical protein
MELSKQSGEFLKNLRVYLFSSGKNEKEIEDIICELEDHLREAEGKGKNVTDIIGKSPKVYMEQIAQEMSIDIKGLVKYLPIIMFGSLAYIILGDALRGELEYSLLEMIGYPLILVLFLILISISFKYLAVTQPNFKHWLVFGFLGAAPLTLFLGLYYLNRKIETVSITFGTGGHIAAIILTISLFIALALWSKTWISIIIPLILFLPEFIINQTNLEESTKLIISGLAMPILMGVYFLVMLKMEKKEEASFK